MEPENIDWKNIESVFEEDEKYESFDAPKWIDLSAPDHDRLLDDQSWFCNSNCKHSKAAPESANQRCNSKGKVLRSLSISEILPFGDRNRRDVKTNDTKFSKQMPRKANRFDIFPRIVRGDDGDRNRRDVKTSDTSFPKQMSQKTKRFDLFPRNVDGENEDPNTLQGPGNSPGPRLRSTFSARNLAAGREVMSHIAGLYAGVKRLAMKGSKKAAPPPPESGSDRVLGELKQRVRDRGPLLVREQ